MALSSSSLAKGFFMVIVSEVNSFSATGTKQMARKMVLRGSVDADVDADPMDSATDGK